jgi:hypothetical protein
LYKQVLKDKYGGSKSMTVVADKNSNRQSEEELPPDPELNFDVKRINEIDNNCNSGKRQRTQSAVDKLIDSICGEVIPNNVIDSNPMFYIKAMPQELKDLLQDYATLNQTCNLKVWSSTGGKLNFTFTLVLDNDSLILCLSETENEKLLELCITHDGKGMLLPILKQDETIKHSKFGQFMHTIIWFAERINANFKSADNNRNGKLKFIIVKIFRHLNDKFPPYLKLLGFKTLTTESIYRFELAKH